MFEWLERLLFGKEAVSRKRRQLQLQATIEEINKKVAEFQAKGRTREPQESPTKGIKRDNGIRCSIRPIRVPDHHDGIRYSLRPIIPVDRESTGQIDFSSVKRERTFAQRLNELVKRHCDGVPSKCYGCAGVRRQTYSKIISTGGQNVSKRIALQLCIGAHATLREAIDLLESAGYALSKSSYEDAVFRWCLENEVYSMTYLNELLVHCNCKPCELVY